MAAERFAAEQSALLVCEAEALFVAGLARPASGLGAEEDGGCFSR